MKRNLFDECLEDYREDFARRLKERETALALDLEAANLGADVIERGQRELMREHNVDIERWETQNKELSQALKKRRQDMHAKLLQMPQSARDERRNFNLTMQKAATVKSDPLLAGPAHEFLVGVVRECEEDDCRADTAVDYDLGRIHVDLRAQGAGTNRMRSAEIWASFIWSFTPEETSEYIVVPYVEFHGIRSCNREYHCYSDGSGTGTEFNAYIGFSQPSAGGGVLPGNFRRIDMSLPPSGAVMRCDGIAAAPYIATFFRDHEVHLQVSLQFRCNGRSRYCGCELNFGNPRSDNYITMPWLSYNPI
jgi:hypothetical protein